MYLFDLKNVSFDSKLFYSIALIILSPLLYLFSDCGPLIHWLWSLWCSCFFCSIFHLFALYLVSERVPQNNSSGFLGTVTFFLILRTLFLMFLLKGILFSFHGCNIHFCLWRCYIETFTLLRLHGMAYNIQYNGKELRLHNQLKCQQCHWLWPMTLSKLPDFCLSIFLIKYM